jgi:hypothetical protein
MPIDLIPEYSGGIPLIWQDSETFNANTASKLQYDKDTFGAGGTFNVAVGQINDTAAQVSTDATTASSAAAEAVGATNYKGTWSSATGAYVSPASFLHNGEVWLLLVDVADITATEPSDVNSDWLRLPSSAIQDANSAAISILQFAEYNSSRVYSYGDVVYKTIGGVKKFFQWYSNVESLAGKDPELDGNRQTGWIDDTKPFYWTPFKGSRPGTPLWPWMSMTFPEGTLNVVGNSVPKAVFWRLAEAFPEFINGDFIDFPETGGEFFRVLDQGRGVDINRSFASYQTNSIQSHQHQMGAIPTTTISGGQSYPAATDTNFTAGVSTYHAGGSETRPRNLAFPILVEV